MRGFATAAVVLATVLAGVACMGGGSDDVPRAADPSAQLRLVAVPNVVGFGAADALRLLERRGLRWRWSEPACPDNGFFESDVVYAQTGPVGRLVPHESVITLVPASTHVVTSRVPPCSLADSVARFDLR